MQDRVAAEVATMPDTPDFSQVAGLRLMRDVFRETLRLYPPVPMMVRENRCPVQFRGRKIAKGGQIVLSPWHLHRHERLWETPDAFDPDRWQTDAGRTASRAAFIPFSAGPRVCPGAGFAMIEGTLLLATLIRAFRFEATIPPVPVAHLTVRARDGIALRVTRRTQAACMPAQG
jgi:cytochrome P450